MTPQEQLGTLKAERRIWGYYIWTFSLWLQEGATRRRQTPQYGKKRKRGARDPGILIMTKRRNSQQPKTSC